MSNAGHGAPELVARLSADSLVFISACGCRKHSEKSPRCRHRSGGTIASSSDSLKSSVNQARRQKVIEALAGAKGNKSAAARLLGVDRRTVYNMIKELDIDDA